MYMQFGPEKFHLHIFVNFNVLNTHEKYEENFGALRHLQHVQKVGGFLEDSLGLNKRGGNFLHILFLRGGLIKTFGRKTSN